MTMCVMEGLFDVAFNGDIIMLLAKDIEYLTPEHWIVHLQEGVKFNNGNPFTASDVLFSMGVYRGSGLNATKAQMMDLEKTTAIDDYTIDFWWEQYRTNQWGILSDMLIFDEESYDPEVISAAPIGTGPYRVVEYMTNSHIKLERRDDYYGEIPVIKTLMFRVIAEPSQVANALETGNVDVATIALSDVDYISKLPGLYVKERLQGNWATLGFNIQEPSIFYHNPVARYAVCHAINRQAIIDIVFLGKGTIMHSPLTNTCLDYEPRFDDLHEIYSIGYDVALAKQRADESGLTGKEIVIATNGLANSIAIAEIVQNMLKEINVTVVINNYDPATLLTITQGSYDLYDMTVGSAINPGNRVGGTLANGIRFYPDMQKPGLFTEQARMMEIMMGVFFEVDDQKRSDINYEMFQLYTTACFGYALADVLTPWAYANDLVYESMVYRLHQSVRYANVKLQ